MTATGWSPTDSAYQARLLRAHEDLRASAESAPHAGDGLVREEVLASWRRSLAALPDPSAAVEAAIEGQELEQARRHHVFDALLPLLRSRLIDPAVEAGLMVALGDAQGRLLWVEARPRMISRADDMGFAPGADWSEHAMGTSAPALALTSSSSVQVVGAEHFHEAVHPWSCSAVPVLHPHTRQTVGVLDVTGGSEAVAPLVLPLLEATARAVQDELRTHLTPPSEISTDPPHAERGSRRTRILPRSPAPVGPAELLLTGRRTPLLRQGSRTVELSGRHAELLTLLHLTPDGVTGAELAEQLHGTPSTEGTVRAEVVRLRKVLAAADGLGIASRPYRLQGRFESDLRRLQDALEHGDLEAALSHSRGELLPTSAAPVIEDLRRSTGSHLRELLLESGSDTQLWRYAQRPEAVHDLEVLMAFLEVAPADAPERAAAVVRAQELRGETD